MKNLVIEARLASPIMLRGFLTFDSLLGALAAETLGDWSQIPLECSDGLYHASAAIIEPYADSALGISASVRWQHDWQPGILKPARGGVQTRLSPKRKREFGQVLNNYRLLHANRVRWNVRGDRTGIADLIRDVKCIGKRRASGWGHVSGWGVRETVEDHSIVGPGGEAMRPVPFDRFTGDTSLPLTEAAWRPAYWDIANRAACYAPELETAVVAPERKAA